MMRVAVVDIGTNSTRLLVADVDGDGASTRARPAHRPSRASARASTPPGALADEAMERVFAALDDYRGDHRASSTPRSTVGVLTSAVRDAANGAAFTAAVRERFGLDARTIPGDEEARLTFLGATSERAPPSTDASVIDIGGGSTELVVGAGARCASTSPPRSASCATPSATCTTTRPRRPSSQRCATDAARRLRRRASRPTCATVERGSPSPAPPRQCAAIAMASSPTTPRASTGHVSSAASSRSCSRAWPRCRSSERREVPGLHPDRAPTIVAGVAILLEALRGVRPRRVEVSEHDILRGAALEMQASRPLARADPPAIPQRRQSGSHLDGCSIVRVCHCVRYSGASGDGRRAARPWLRPRRHRSGRSRIESAPPAAWTA